MTQWWNNNLQWVIGVGLITYLLVRWRIHIKLKEYVSDKDWGKVFKNQTENSSAGQSQKIKFSDIIVIIGCVIFAHFMLHYYAPNIWWWLSGHLMFWVDQVAVIPLYLFCRKEVPGRKNKKDWDTKGKVAVPILVVLTILNLFNGGKYPLNQNISLSSLASTPAPSVHLSKKEVGLDMLAKANIGVKEKVVEFWENNLNDHDSQEMIEFTAGRSGFFHFEKDGKTAIKSRVSGSDNVGVMQISQSLWERHVNKTDDPNIKKLDLNKLEDNLKIALHLQKLYKLKYEFKLWTVGDMKNIPLVYTNVAPVDGWSQKINLPPFIGEFPDIYRDGSIIARTNLGMVGDGKIYHPGEVIHIEHGSKYIELQSKQLGLDGKGREVKAIVYERSSN